MQGDLEPFPSGFSLKRMKKRPHDQSRCERLQHPTRTVVARREAGSFGEALIAQGGMYIPSLAHDRSSLRNEEEICDEKPLPPRFDSRYRLLTSRFAL